ncbi:LytTR family transcriptional regulator DNA-binding domain-containing protein [Candidatus Contubernalis alkaliaceticus]|uniref:LytTR family transcriptional regulator DNA-binding domain-containing protein n=1 Tax=Candidatus Contubernalis alkaliaceticus TaxID=338645 RepID=UPI001F4BE5FE|nr:LytTR family transcriptional regulator DNA-binding domain-containing protein [Candidatus Contubernalis alkalaceticus]UNC92157.1 LytTR family transcriptional regulator DNA-binding domain-containing protein [Candidatus Contubernalis alkalaceticus]
MIQAQRIKLVAISHHITFTVNPGEIMGVIGSPGSGKTTLQKILAGTIPPPSGKVICAQKRGILFEENFSYERLTVKENLSFFASLYGTAYKSVNRLVEEFSLQEFLNHKCSLLETGILRRLNLAVVLLGSPQVLLLDEPFLKIDRLSHFVMQEVINNLVEEGCSLILTTFGQREAVNCCQRLLYLETGEIVPTALDKVNDEKIINEDGDKKTQKSQLSSSPWQRIPVYKDDTTVLLSPEEILYIQTTGGQMEVVTTSGTFEARYTLSALEEKLVGEGFFRSHRSCLVNLQEVKEIVKWSKNSFELNLRTPGFKVPLSKHRVDELKSLLNL